MAYFFQGSCSAPFSTSIELRFPLSALSREGSRVPAACFSDIGLVKYCAANHSSGARSYVLRPSHLSRGDRPSSRNESQLLCRTADSSQASTYCNASPAAWTSAGHDQIQSHSIFQVSFGDRRCFPRSRLGRQQQ